MQYVELRYTIPIDQAELAASALTEAGADGLEEQDYSTIEHPATGEVVLVAWISPEAADAFVERAARALTALSLPPERSRPTTRERDENEWCDAWKRYFHARPVGRFVIVPSWETYVPKNGEIVLNLDPGRAFGTGGHASTRLCLRAIDAIPDDRIAPSDRVLDVGCGSGVLSIAATRRWAALTGHGIDIDDEAVLVSRENAERNQVADRLSFSTTSLEQCIGPTRLVLANIQPEVLIPMAPSLVACVASAGTLILAGIVDEAAASVRAAYAAQGLPEPTPLVEEGWTALLYQWP